MLVRLHDKILPAKRAHQHQQRGLGKVKVGQQSVNNAEPKSRIDKQVGLAAPGRNTIFTCSERCKFQSAHGRGTDSNHAPPVPLRQVDLLSRCSGNLIPLAMQLVVFDPIDPHRLKRSQAHMQSDLGNFNSAYPNAFEDFRSEVQPRGRSRHRASRPGVNRLVTIAVFGPVFAVDVRRQGHMADSIYQGKEVWSRIEPDATFAKVTACNNFCLKRDRITEMKPLADPNLPARPNQALPLVQLTRHLAREQHLDLSVQEFLGGPIVRTDWMSTLPAPMTVKASGKDPRIVHDQQVIRPQQIGEIAERTVPPIPSLTVQMQQTRPGPIRQRFLGDPFRR